MDLSKLSSDEIINLYPSLLDELKKRKIIRTNNVIGEIAEYLVEQAYNKDTSLPKLQLGINSTKNIDAISVNGERYAIKSTSGTNTGVFSSIPLVDDGNTYFEYLIILMFDKNYKIKTIIELTWKDFLKYRKIKKPENKFSINVTKDVLENAKKIK